MARIISLPLALVFQHLRPRLHPHRQAPDVDEAWRCALVVHVALSYVASEKSYKLLGDLRPTPRRALCSRTRTLPVTWR